MFRPKGSWELGSRGAGGATVVLIDRRLPNPPPEAEGGNGPRAGGEQVSGGAQGEHKEQRGARWQETPSLTWMTALASTQRLLDGVAGTERSRGRG